MIDRILSFIFRYREKPGYAGVKTLATPKRRELPKEADVRELLDALREKHIVDSITVFTRDGTLIASTCEGDFLKEFALFENISRELDATHVFVKKDDWLLFFAKGKYVFIVRAPNYINTIELAILARDVERTFFAMGW